MDAGGQRGSIQKVLERACHELCFLCISLSIFCASTEKEKGRKRKEEGKAGGRAVPPAPGAATVEAIPDLVLGVVVRVSGGSVRSPQAGLGVSGAQAGRQGGYGRPGGCFPTVLRSVLVPCELTTHLCHAIKTHTSLMMASERRWAALPLWWGLCLENTALGKLKRPPHFYRIEN